MKIFYSSTSLRQIKRFSKTEQVKILKKIEKLKNDPNAGKKLKGPLKDLRSLKVWPYRIIYHYSNTEQIIFINVIQHRQIVYKDLSQ